MYILVILYMIFMIKNRLIRARNGSRALVDHWAAGHGQDHAVLQGRS